MQLNNKTYLRIIKLSLRLTCLNVIEAVHVHQVSKCFALKLCKCCELTYISWQFVPGTRSRELKRGLSTFSLKRVVDLIMLDH